VSVKSGLLSALLLLIFEIHENLTKSRK